LSFIIILKCKDIMQDEFQQVVIEGLNKILAGK